MFFSILLNNDLLQPNNSCSGTCYGTCISGESAMSETCGGMCKENCSSECTSVDQRAYEGSEGGDGSTEVCITRLDSCKYGCLSSCQLSCRTGCLNVESIK